MTQSEPSVTGLPVDELPCGLPLFNVFLHVPAYAVQLQLFRVVCSYVIDRFTLHTLLVHPEELDAVAELADAVGFFQLHGEVWRADTGPEGMTVRRIGQPTGYQLRRSADGQLAELRDRSGRLLRDDPLACFLADDLVKVHQIRECFLREYDDAALSVPLIRAYPGRTSLITRTRPFTRLFSTDPIGPETDVRDGWAGLGGPSSG